MRKKEQAERDWTWNLVLQELSNCGGQRARRSHHGEKNIIDSVDSGAIKKISDPDLQKVFRNYYEDANIGDRFAALMDEDGDGVCTYEESTTDGERMFEMTDIRDE